MIDTAAAAALLLREHDERTRFSTIREAFPFDDISVSYDIQRDLVGRLCERAGCDTVGYKIGLTSARMQAMCGIPHPLAGQILRSRVHRSGARVALSEHVRVGVECEIAVRLGRDIDAGSLPATIAELSGAVAAVAPALELIEDRNADYAALDMFTLVADNSWNAGIVLGEFRENWPDLAAVTGIVEVNGAEVDRGFGRDVLGHPFEPLLWLARHLVHRGETLAAGDIVMTGSLVPTRFPAAGDRYRFSLDGLGTVEAGFVD
ncbi:MAG TPA: fumarylacetoacetate hydrolase family protein [Saliniramus sp.]|nr:fumarylacetoacetate hydrolase family protein [Saliniramus sp.]